MAKVVYNGFTQEELDKAFKSVQNKENWKGSICATIPADQKEVVEAAIDFFAYGGADFLPVADSTDLKVIAPGYWGMEYELSLLDVF